MTATITPTVPVESDAPSTLKVADVLDRAAHVIEDRGWCQGDWSSENGSVCALGAMAVAVEAEWTEYGPCFTGPFDSKYQAWDLAARHFHRWVNRDGIATSGVGTWNDAFGRTADEVVAAMVAAAAEVRGEL